MIEYVTLDQAKKQLMMDHDDDDSRIQMLIQSASYMVKFYIKKISEFEVERDSNNDPVLDSNGDTIVFRDSNGDKLVLPPVQQATLYLIGVMYADRDGQNTDIWTPGFLPEPAKNCLTQLRDPTLA